MILADYTQLNTGQPWEAFSRTGKFADVVVQLPKAGGRLVFWRGNSYLPFWKTDKGQWDLAEIVPRSGDGARPMPDRANVYAHAEVIENTPSAVVVHWRYLSSFSAGNPHGNVNPNNFVDELFTITPDGRVKRVVKKGTDKIDDWNDPLNQLTQTLQVSPDGVVEISRSAPRHSLRKSGLRAIRQKGPWSSPLPYGSSSMKDWETARRKELPEPLYRFWPQNTLEERRFGHGP